MLEREDRREWEMQGFFNFSILTETDYRFQKNKIEERKNSGDKAT